MSVIALAEPRTPPSDIVWPAPTVHNVNAALDAAGCLTERLAALLDSNTADMQEGLIDGEGMSEWQRGRAYSIWMIYVLAGEKLAELNNLIGAITTAAYEQPKTSVGQHVDLRRRAAFAAASKAFRAANAVSVPEDADDVTFDSIADPVVNALNSLINTRSPNLRALHEKLTVIRQEDAFNCEKYGTLDAIFDDIEYLARRYEIDGDSADQAEG